MHVDAWLDRLASAGGEARRRLLDALERLGPDAATVLAPLPGETALLMADIVSASAAEQETAWRTAIGPAFERLGLPMPPPAESLEAARSGHSVAFGELHDLFTSVRRIDPAATW